MLSGRIAVKNAVLRWVDGGLDVLPAGPVPFNPSELLASRATAALLDEVRQRYDYVIIDAPAVLPVTDAAAVAARADGVVLVVRYGRTSEEQVAAAVNGLEAVGAPLLGVALTGTPPVPVAPPPRGLVPRAGPGSAEPRTGRDPAAVATSTALCPARVPPLRSALPRGASPRVARPTASVTTGAPHNGSVTNGAPHNGAPNGTPTNGVPAGDRQPDARPGRGRAARRERAAALAEPAQLERSPAAISPSESGVGKV